MIAGLFSLPLASADAPPERLRAGRSAAVRSGGEGCASFDRFIAGPENALVRTLADAALSDPPDYNPLVICGPVGVGKTALAHALAALRREHFGLTRIVVTTGSDLVRALAHAIETDGAADFRTLHHECDVLLIDNVHELAGKSAAQQFFLAAFDELARRNTLVIATLRQLPQATEHLSAPLTGRLAGGLIVPLAPPGALARRELVRNAAARTNLPVNESLLAKLAGDDSRLPLAVMPADLRHAVLQAAADAPAFATARNVDTRQVCKLAAAAVARHSDLTLTELRGKSRRQAVADARGLAMYLARHISGASYAEIGRHFGNRDHTTVLHACHKFTDRIARDDATRRLAEELHAQVFAECRA